MIPNPILPNIDDLLYLDSAFALINQITNDINKGDIASFNQLVSHAIDITIVKDNHDNIKGVAITVPKPSLKRKTVINSYALRIDIFDAQDDINQVEPIMSIPMLNPYAHIAMESAIAHLNSINRKITTYKLK